MNTTKIYKEKDKLRAEGWTFNATSVSHEKYGSANFACNNFPHNCSADVVSITYVSADVDYKKLAKALKIAILLSRNYFYICSFNDKEQKTYVKLIKLCDFKQIKSLNYKSSHGNNSKVLFFYLKNEDIEKE